MDVDHAPDGAELSRWVTSNIEALRQEAGMTVSQVIDESGSSRSGYYSRLRDETTWTLEDLARFSAVFAVDPSTLLVPPVASSSSSDVQVNGIVLACRLSLLQAAMEIPSDSDELSVRMREAGVEITPELWDSLTAGSRRVSVAGTLLASIAGFFGVDPSYLTAPESDPTTDRLEAQLELRAALRESGGGKLGLRALGDVPPSALRAIARSLRSAKDSKATPGS